MNDKADSAHCTGESIVNIGDKEIDCEEVVKAFIESELIQFDPSQPDFVFSVWGFTRWEHDADLVTAIRKVKTRLQENQP